MSRNAPRVHIERLKPLAPLPVIVSIATAGHVPEVFGLLYIIAMLLSIVGEIFARMGLQSQKGGVRGKRISIWLNIVSFVVPVIIILLGRF